MAVDQPHRKDMVRFETLKGVTPNGYRLAFRKTYARKDKASGNAIEWDAKNAAPIFLSHYPYYRQLEITSEEELRFSLLELDKAVSSRVSSTNP